MNAKECGAGSIVAADIVNLERVTGLSYGEPPRIFEDCGWLSRYGNYLRSQKYFPTAFISGLIISSIPGSDASYDWKTHTINLPRNKIKDRWVEFARRHELGHGFVRSRNKEYGRVDDFLVRGLTHMTLLGSNLSEEIITRAFMRRCVDEGIADYLAIITEKYLASQGVDPRMLYCFEREQMLVTRKNVEEDTIVVESTALDRENVAGLAEAGEELIEAFFEVNNISSRVAKVKEVLRMVGCFHDYAYYLGHYLVRSSCEQPGVPIGETLLRLIESPPTTPQDLQDAVTAALDL